MAGTLELTCPQCETKLVVPAAAAGKRIKCKKCSEIIAVPGEAAPVAAKPVAAKPVAAKPVAAKPVAAKPVPPPPPPPPPPADAPLKFKDDDEDEDDSKAFGIIKEDERIRCPHCAEVLDPPDARICIHCGFDMMERKRHKSRKVYATGAEDYTSHYGPAIAWLVVIFIALGISITFWVNMEDWMTKGMLDKEEKAQGTGKPTFYINPGCFNVFTSVAALGITFVGMRVIVKRFILTPAPVETEKYDSDEDEDYGEEDIDDDDEEEEEEEEEEKPKKKKKK